MEEYQSLKHTRMVSLKDYHGISSEIPGEKFQKYKNSGFRKLKIRTDNSLTIKTEES